MSSMHHALSLHEIRACIAHSVGLSADRSGQALVALACTNQMFSEVALDQIWRMPPIRELVNHMPAESYILSSHSKFNIPTQGIAATPWLSIYNVVELNPVYDLARIYGSRDRFQFYSKRVVGLDLRPVFGRNSSPSADVSLGSNMLKSWADNLECFPRLNKLILPTSFLDITFEPLRGFLVQPILCLEIIHDQSSCMSRDDLAILRQHAMPNIKCLTFSSPSYVEADEARQIEVVSKLILATEDLVRMDSTIPVISSAWRHLLGSAGMNLRHLTVGIAEEHSPSEVVPLYAFRHLEDLNILGIHAMIIAHQILSMQPNHRLVNLKLDISLTSPMDDIFAPALVGLGRLIGTHTSISHLVLEIMVVHGDQTKILIQDEDWTSFHQTLTTLPMLEEYHLQTWRRIDIDPAEIHSLARQWHRLRRWTVTYMERIPSDYNTSWSDFLETLKLCPSLQGLPLCVWFSNENLNESMQSTPNYFPYGPTLTMDGEGDARQITSLILNTLPRVKNILESRSGSWDDDWGLVEQVAYFVQLVYQRRY